MKNETIRATRYDKIEKAIFDEIEEKAKGLRDWYGCEHDESYNRACETFLNNLEDNVSSVDIYYIIELMFQERYGYIPCGSNPYTIKVGQ